jgi:broad specificity phosphatase PhoE
MKWPSNLTMIRHAPSNYNGLKTLKEKDRLYQVFKGQFDKNHRSPITKILACYLKNKYALNIGDCDTELGGNAELIAHDTGVGLKETISVPDIIYLSPYLRTKSTYKFICTGWPELIHVPVFEDERLREQEHGIANLFNDWRIFFTYYPEQKDLYNYEGAYWYQYPQGENVPLVRERSRSLLGTFIREFSEQRVMTITHHLSILAQMANLERWDHKKFLDYDNNKKPLNCGVTHYLGHPEKGKSGKLELDFYNRIFYKV